MVFTWSAISKKWIGSLKNISALDPSHNYEKNQQTQTVDASTLNKYFTIFTNYKKIFHPVKVYTINYTLQFWKELI